MQQRYGSGLMMRYRYVFYRNDTDIFVLMDCKNNFKYF